MVSTQHYNMAHSFSMYVYSYIYNMYSNFTVSAEGRGKMLNTSIHSSSPRSQRSNEHSYCSEFQGAAIVTRTPREYSRGGGVFLESSGKNTFRTIFPAVDKLTLYYDYVVLTKTRI